MSAVDLSRRCKLVAQIVLPLRGNSLKPYAQSICGLLLSSLLGWVLPASAQTDLAVYSDALASGWQDWSWATINPACTTPVHAGSKSLSVTAGAWQAAYLTHTAFDTSPYTALTFWIQGGATGGQQLQVQALLNGVAQPAVALPALPANTWQPVTVTLAALGVANQPDMDGFWIQDRSGTSQPTFYLDDIRLTAAPAPALVHFNVYATQTVRVADARLFGLNTAVWDSVLDTTNTIGLLRDLDNRALRFPGGSLADEYDWTTNTTGTNRWTWASSFSQFVDLATNTQAQTFITVNYGSGTPASAAAWVRQANVTQHLAFRYWEVGNENYGTWETDLNARPHDPFTYATRFKDYAAQMKAADPSIKIGAVCVTGEDSYANYSDHPATNARTHAVHTGWTPVLLATLKSLGVTPDFLIYHRYEQEPGAENDATLLQAAATWPNDAADLRQQLNDYLGATATNVELVCTENNSISTNPGKQSTSLVNGLYLADSLGHILQTEFNACLWWDLRNGQESGNNNDSGLYGWRPYGDYGVVDSANPAGRYPTFYVAKLLKYFARGGDRIVNATSDYPLLTVFAAQRQDTSLTLLVINKHPTATLTANLALTGYQPDTNVVLYSYGIPQDQAAQSGSGSPDVALTNRVLSLPGTTLAFAPYSVSVLTFQSAGGGAPATAALAVTANPSGGGTVAGGVTYPVGTNVQLTAIANTGWSFLCWSDGALHNPRSVIVPAGGATYTASFGSTSGLGAALEATNLPWSLGGQAAWASQAGTQHGTATAAQSGAIGAGQQTWLQTTVTGPGSLTFWWKVSAAATSQLQFFVNTQLVSQLSGNVNWTQYVTYLSTTNSFTLKWVYEKNSAASAGSDAGWVDQVTWQPCPYATHVPQVFYQDPTGLLASWVLNSTGGMRFARLLANTGGWALKAAGDIDGDGVSDLLFQSAGGDAGRWFMNADGSTRDAGFWFNLGGWEIKACGDYEGTGRSQLFFQTAHGDVAYWRLDTNGNAQASVPLGNMGMWKLRGLGDLDGDHKAELFWQNPSGLVAIWYHRPDGSIYGTTPFNTGDWALCGVADLDGDGVCDLLWQDGVGNTGGWFMNSNSTARAASFWWNTGGWKLKAAGR